MRGLIKKCTPQRRSLLALTGILLTSVSILALSSQVNGALPVPGDWWDYAKKSTDKPVVCRGNSWWNSYYGLSSPKGTWAAHEYKGSLSFPGRGYDRYHSYAKSSFNIEELTGVNKYIFEIVGPPHKIPMPDVPADGMALTLEACRGMKQERSFNWSDRRDREYYLFADSVVVRSNDFGWREVRGAIKSKYAQNNGWLGWLGIPTTNELDAWGGKISHFTSGRIFWTAQTGTATMKNDVYALWERLGGAHGPLGRPIRDNVSYVNAAGMEMEHGNQFQNNCAIYWRRSGLQAGTRAYCNGREVTSWTPTQPTPQPVANKQPVASFTYSRLTGAGNRVTLDAGASRDPDGHITRWQWTRDGAPLPDGKVITVSMGDVRSATVKLTVTDNRNSTGTQIRALTLPNRTPVFTGISPSTGSTVGSNTPTLSASTKDDDGDSISYHFRVTGPMVDISSDWGGNSWKVPQHRLDPGTTYNWTVTARDRDVSIQRSSAFTVAMLPTANELVSLSTGNGYWEVASDGGVFSYGAAQFYGSLPGLNVRVNNIIGMARTPTDKGYWLVGKDGGVFAFGDAGFHGSLPSLNVRVGNIVGMAPTKDGKGYWLVGSDGGVFAFGNAGFFGSMGGKLLNRPVQAIAPTASGNGYWLAAEDGGVFAFGDAPFYGSMGGQHLNYPVVDIDTTPDGKGYWLVAQDGGIFAYGNAGFFGSMAGQPLNGHINSMSIMPDGKGYWLNGCDGGIFAFGSAPFLGSQPRYGCRGIWY